MKLITRKNFIPIVCICFTFLVLGKLIWEKIIGFTDPYYTENIFMTLGFAIVIPLVLAIHYYLQKYPFLPVFIGQYLFTVTLVMVVIWILGHFVTLAPTAYRDMFISVTIPFIVLAAIYYISFFRQIKKANKLIEKLNEE